jgi:hemolysin activation/secretion protein
MNNPGLTGATKAYMPTNKYLPYLLLALSPSVWAAQPPNASSQIQQIPPAPIQQKPTPEINLEQSNLPAVPSADHEKILVRHLKISGAETYSEAELLAITGFKPDSKLSLADLRGMALMIAEFYHLNGFFVAQAYLPAQEIKDGIVTIAVIEGRYGNITLHNQTNLSDNLANIILKGLNNGDLITYVPLENRLLLLSDLPGVKIKSTLMPGSSAGSSDLIVNITPEQRVSGSVDADNAGNRYTGENRIGATLNLNNPAGFGDVATIRALTSGSGLNYARASYQMQWGKAKAGVAYSSLTYALGQEFESLQANGSANISSLYGSYSLMRSRNNNLFFQLSYDAKTFQDKVDSTFSVTDKRADVLTASLNGELHDNFSGGGLNSYSLAWIAGNIDLQTPAMQSLDAATVQSNGNYSKLGFSFTRLQSVTDLTSLYALVDGQFASKNLDVSEKMELGGMYAVRAYPEGESYADQGYVLNLESRTLLPKLSEKLSGQMQFIGFVDSGTVQANKNSWLLAQNTRTLSGAGMGLNWSGAHNFMLRTYYARKLGNDAATSAPDTSGRFWMQAVKYF